MHHPSILFFQSVEKGARPGKNLKARVRNPAVDRFSLLQRLWLRLGTLLRSGNSHFQQFLDCGLSTWMAGKFSQVLIKSIFSSEKQLAQHFCGAAKSPTSSGHLCDQPRLAGNCQLRVESRVGQILIPPSLLR